MTFASLEFATLHLLLAVSYVFYCYWKPVYGLLIFASTVLDYAMAIAISATTSRRYKQLSLLTSIIGNLGILSYFKYTNSSVSRLSCTIFFSTIANCSRNYGNALHRALLFFYVPFSTWRMVS